MPVSLRNIGPNKISLIIKNGRQMTSKDAAKKSRVTDYRTSTFYNDKQNEGLFLITIS